MLTNTGWLPVEKPDDLEKELALLFQDEPETAKQIQAAILDYERNVLPLIVKENEQRNRLQPAKKRTPL